MIFQLVLTQISGWMIGLTIINVSPGSDIITYRLTGAADKQIIFLFQMRFIREPVFVVWMLVNSVASSASLRWTNPIKACITGHDDFSAEGVRDIEACQELCENHVAFRCLSIDFNSGRCMLSRYRKDTLLLKESYYQPCDAWYHAARVPSEDAACMESWTDVRAACISGHNDRVIANVASMQDCKELCIEEDSFPCRSVNYHLSDGCKLSRVGQDTVTPSTDYQQPCPVSDYMYAERLDLGHWTSALSACLRQHNDKVMREVANIEECKELCMMEKSFLCRSIDFKDEDGTCEMSRDDRYIIYPKTDYTQPCYDNSSNWQHAERFWML